MPSFLMTPRLLAASAGIGLAYLPISTSSILIFTQLAFTAAFMLLLVRQRFTVFSVNVLALLSVSAAMRMNAAGDRLARVTRARYAAGFAMTLGAAVPVRRPRARRNGNLQPMDTSETKAAEYLSSKLRLIRRPAEH